MRLLRLQQRASNAALRLVATRRLSPGLHSDQTPWHLPPSRFYHFYHIHYIHHTQTITSLLPHQSINPPTHRPTTMVHHALFGTASPRWEFSVDAWKHAQGLHTVQALHEMTAERLERYLRDKILEDLELYSHTSIPHDCLCVACFSILTCPFVVLGPLPRPTWRFLPPTFFQAMSNPGPSRIM